MQRSVLLILAVLMAACSATRPETPQLGQDERHQLYTAALTVSDSPMESDDFKRVCIVIGIFDKEGSPNDSYLPFVAEHVQWAMRDDSKVFRNKINSREAAREFISKHLNGVAPVP